MGNNGSQQAKEMPKTEESHCSFYVEHNQEQPQKIKLTDATPSNLQNALDLQSAPKVLKDKNGICIFHKDGSTWSSKLEANSHYSIGVQFSRKKEIRACEIREGNLPTANQKQTLPALDSMDVHCAIICSKAAQLCGFKEEDSKRDEIKAVFKKFIKEKHFDEICPSIYGEVQYILARSEKVLYIAFAGDDFSSMMAPPTKVDMEFLKDGEKEHLRRIKGNCNEYIWKQRYNVHVKLILGTICKSEVKRVVVCGHGVGGAIANVFALCLQLRLNLLKAKGETSVFPELVCITFGAPRCLSKAFAEEVGHLDNFFNIINIRDPVPILLDQVAGFADNPPWYINTTLKKKIEAKFQELLRKMTTFLSEEDHNDLKDAEPHQAAPQGNDAEPHQCTPKGNDAEPHQAAPQRNDAEPHQATPQGNDLDKAQMIEEIKGICKENNITFEDIIKCPFYPLGWYIFCCHDEKDVESDCDAPFDISDLNTEGSIRRFDNRRVCFTKNASLVTKLLAKTKIQESGFSQHLNCSYFKMVSQTISKNYRSSLATEDNEQEVGQAGMAQFLYPSCDITNLFPPEVDQIELTKQTTFHWTKMWAKKQRLAIVIKGKNLGFFSLCDSNFNRLPILKDSQPEIKKAIDERIDLLWEFDANKVISDRPSVDVATHFGILRFQINKDDIKEIEAKTLTNSFVDGLSPLLLLRAWQRGISSVILAESASRDSEIENNKLLSRLYKLEKNSLKGDRERETSLLDYSKEAAKKDFLVLGEPDPELLEMLVGIIEGLSDELIIEYSLFGRNFLNFIGTFMAGKINSVLCLLVDPKSSAKVIRAVENPNKHASRLLKNEAYKMLCKSIGKPFVAVEKDYFSMLSTFIRRLREVNEQRRVSEETKPTIYELEETLYDKYNALGYFGKDPDKILNEEGLDSTNKSPFKDNVFKGVLISSKSNVLRRIQLSCDMFQLRQHLKEDCYIGIVGPQDAGKSTLIKQVWNLDVGDIGYTKHTDSAHVFGIPGASKLKVVDFPGSTSIKDSMANVIKACGGMASFLILVMPYIGDVSRTHLKEFENTEEFQLPTLVCINKCAMFFRHSEDFKSEKSVDAARERYAKALNVEAKDVFFTEFLKCRPKIKAKGIADIAEVKNWIETKLTQLEFYKENDDELNYALNRCHSFTHVPQ